MATLRLALALGAVVLVPAGSAAPLACTAVAGPFSSKTVAGPPCTSPILLCTDGTLEGDLAGSYDFSMNSLAPTLAPEDPFLLVFTGESLIATARGTMDAVDTGTMRYNPVGKTPFTTLVRIVDGTGGYEGVGGFLIAQGEIDFAAGIAVGAYRGALCT